MIAGNYSVRSIATHIYGKCDISACNNLSSMQKRTPYPGCRCAAHEQGKPCDRQKYRSLYFKDTCMMMILFALTRADSHRIAHREAGKGFCYNKWK